jgi:hypothetical protein
VDQGTSDARPWLALPRTMILEEDRGLRLQMKLSHLYQHLRRKQVGSARTPR